MSTKSKKPVAKATPKKPAAKAPAKKPAAKASAAKKPAAKAQTAKKPVAKKTQGKKPAEKKQAEKKVSVPKAAEPSKKEVVRKPITVVKKAPRPPLKKAEPAVVFENQSQSAAFTFAEMMKKRQRELDASRKEASDASSVKLTRRPTSRTRGEASQQFPASDLADFRKRLILLRQEAMGQSATLKTIALEHTDDRGSEDDDGSDAFMRLQNLSQVDSHNKVIQQIDEALARIQEGTYGICEMCGQLIRKPRLMNLPFVRTCMECQSAMEENPTGIR